MTNSTKLRTVLSQISGIERVYFNPSESVKLTYPCIVFEEGSGHIVRADNKVYSYTRQYDLKYICKDPDESMTSKLLSLPMCSPGRPYVADNLYHYPFTIYY